MLAIDASLLNVSIPAIGRELGGDLVALKWIVTGKALVYASLMLVGGRIGDMYGHRRMLLIGTSLFGLGGLLASQAPSIGYLMLGESVVKGIGTTIMLPATMAVLSHTYSGAQRSVAFAAWGGIAGAGAAFGPVIGGTLTTHLSWRWCIGLTAALAPVIWIWARRLLEHDGEQHAAAKLDISGAALISLSITLLIVALSEGANLGWWSPNKDVVFNERLVWGQSLPVSPTPVLFLAAATALGLFVMVELTKARRRRDPVLDVRHLRLPAFRYGLVAGVMAATGQWGVVFVLPLFLQLGLGLSPMETGFWLLPAGLCTLAFAQLGGRMAVTRGPSEVVRIGLVIEAAGILLIAVVLEQSMSVGAVVPGLAVYGIGFGLVTSQLSNTIISSVSVDQSGVAGAAMVTARQVGAAFGVAVLGALLTLGATHSLLDRLDGINPDRGTAAAVGAEIRSVGLDLRALEERADDGEPWLEDLMHDSVSGAARLPVLAAALVVGLAAAIPAPRMQIVRRRSDEDEGLARTGAIPDH